MPAHILLVEDERPIADAIVYALATEGMTVRWCVRGGDALQAVGEEDVDLVILDVGLPDIDGFELCRRLQAARHLPVIFLTARASEVDRIVGLEIGADDYVTKPFSPRELAARVRAVLRRCHGGRADASAGGFTVEEDRRRISYRGVPLELTRQQYRLLLALLRRPGQVLSRSRLLDCAWDDPGAGTGRTVDSHIRSIRALLRAIDPRAEPIATCRGEGYAISPDEAGP